MLSMVLFIRRFMWPYQEASSLVGIFCMSHILHPPLRTRRSGRKIKQKNHCPACLSFVSKPRTPTSRDPTTSRHYGTTGYGMGWDGRAHTTIDHRTQHYTKINLKQRREAKDYRKLLQIRKWVKESFLCWLDSQPAS